MDQFKPNIIFSGHMHFSRILTYPPQNIANLVDNRIVTVDLNNFNAVENYRNFTEIMVPTSSYRMGVKKIGYGHAVIGKTMLIWFRYAFDPIKVHNYNMSCDDSCIIDLTPDELTPQSVRSISIGLHRVINA